jgi:hypothetical protein
MIYIKNDYLRRLFEVYVIYCYTSICIICNIMIRKIPMGSIFIIMYLYILYYFIYLHLIRRLIYLLIVMYSL